MPNPRRRKPIPRDQRGIIDRIRRGEVIHDETPVEMEVLLEYQKKCVMIEEQPPQERHGPPGSELKMKQAATVELVRAKDREDRKNGNDVNVETVTEQHDGSC